jgi:hypothetical protein
MAGSNIKRQWQAAISSSNGRQQYQAAMAGRN